MRHASQRRFAANLDDEDSDGPYDPRYPGRKVVADGGRVRVPVMLTDGMPDWASRSRPALYDASHHRPRSAVIDAADPHVREAERAYAERNAFLQDAWKTPSGQMQQPPDNDDDDDDGDLSPRDRYIRQRGLGSPGIVTGAAVNPSLEEGHFRLIIMPR
jgi:hypothetical protein